VRTGIKVRIDQKQIPLKIYSLSVPFSTRGTPPSSLHSLFPPLGALADAEFDVEIEEESSTDYYFCLVQESVINPPIETETQLTSHKTVRTAATFKTSEIDFCKLIFEGRMFEKRIL